MTHADYQASPTTAIVIVTVLARKGGWTTIQLPDGTTKAVRNSQLHNDRRANTDRRDVEDTPVAPKKAAKASRDEEDEDYEDEEEEFEDEDDEVEEEVEHEDEGGEEGDGLRHVKKATYDPADYIKAKSVNGNSTMHCGDLVAVIMLPLTLDQCYQYTAQTIGVPEQELRNKYRHLNPGMQRMNLGNKIRAFNKAKEG